MKEDRPSRETPLAFPTLTSALEAFPFPPVDAVVGILTGGLVPAALVAQRLRLPLYYARIQFRHPDNSERHGEPKILEIPLLPPVCRRILLVDDVSVSGRTMDAARALFPDHTIHCFAIKGQAELVLFPQLHGCVQWPWPRLDRFLADMP